MASCSMKVQAAQPMQCASAKKGGIFTFVFVMYLFVLFHGVPEGYFFL